MIKEERVLKETTLRVANMEVSAKGRKVVRDSKRELRDHSEKDTIRK